MSTVSTTRDDAVAVTVLTGAGGAFCAGADLKALSAGDRRGLAPTAPAGSPAARVGTAPRLAS